MMSSSALDQVLASSRYHFNAGSRSFGIEEDLLRFYGKEGIVFTICKMVDLLKTSVVPKICRLRRWKKGKERKRKERKINRRSTGAAVIP